MSPPSHAKNPWDPVLGEAIGPSRTERTRSAVMLLVLLTALGIGLAAGIGLLALLLLALVGASIG